MDLDFSTKEDCLKNLVQKTKSLLPSLLLAGILIGCGAKPADGTKNLNIQLQMGSYSTVQNQAPLIWKLLGVKEANAAVTSLKMCFKRLRFKTTDVDTAAPDTDGDNKDFFIGEVLVSSAGAVLGGITIPEGTYRRIEFDLDSSCASGKSIQLTNGNGTFSSVDRITIKFSGNFTASADGALTLGVQTILNQLNSYNAPATLKTTAESISGVLAN